MVAFVGAAILTAVGATTLAASAVATYVVGYVVTTAVTSLVVKALTPKQNPQQRVSGYNVNSRGSDLDHQIIYGKARVGGVIVYDGATGDNNKYLHRVIAIAGHEIDSYDEIYFDDEIITLDGSGNVTSPSRYVGKVRVKKHYGASDQSADSDLITSITKWTTAYRLRGVAYLYVRLTFDQDAFPNGVPIITTTVKGKKVYDPSTGVTQWSDNPALCLRDYLTSTTYGLGESSDNIDDDLVIAAATVCDSTDTVSGTTRYTCNGSFTTALAPYDVLTNILTSMGGSVWYSQGKWKMKPAYWVEPTYSFDEDDLRSNLSVTTRHSRRDNFNAVKGTYRGPETNWQTTDYREVTNSAYLIADNNQKSVANIDLPFTDNSIEARRLSRIALEDNRQQISVSASFGLSAMRVQVGDVIKLSNSRFGWTDKYFEVTDWSFGLTNDLDLQVQMTLKETAESIYDEVDDGVVYERDNTTLLSQFDVPTVGLTISDTLRVYLEKLTNFLFIEVTSGSTERIDRIEVQIKKTSDTTWKTVGTGEVGIFEVLDLEDDYYDIRARAINSFNIRGDWTYRNEYQLAGLSQPPADVTNFVAEITGRTIHLSWDAVPDLDLSYYAIRHSKATSGATWSSSTTYVQKVPRPATSVAVPAKAGTYLIRAFDKSGIQSINATTVVVTAANFAGFDVQITQTEDPDFTGNKTNVFVVNDELRLGSTYLFDDITGLLDDQTVAWDTMGQEYTTLSGTYEFSNYIDLGSSQVATVELNLASTRYDSTAGFFDDLIGNLDLLPGYWDDLNTSTAYSDTNVTGYVSYTNSDPASSPVWSDYEKLRTTDIFARAFRFKVELESLSSGVTPSVSELEASVGYNI